MSGVRSAHVLILTNFPKPPAKPIGIAVSGVLSVGQYLLEPIEKNAATLCGLDRQAPGVNVETDLGTDLPLTGGEVDASGTLKVCQA